MLERDQLIRMISEPVSLEFELAACLAEAHTALHFARVIVHSMPVVGNLLNSLPHLAAAPAQVEWTLVACLKPDRDLIVVPGVRAERSEQLESFGTLTKLGIDATRKAHDRLDWTEAHPPGERSAKRANCSAAVPQGSDPVFYHCTT